MKKLSQILLENAAAKRVSSIDTKESFVNWVNEQLKETEGYTEDHATQLATGLLEEFNGSFSEAIEHFKNFQLHEK